MHNTNKEKLSNETYDLPNEVAVKSLAMQRDEQLW